MPRKWFLVSNGLGLMIAAIAMAEVFLCFGRDVFGSGGVILLSIFACLTALHIAARFLLKRSRTKRLTAWVGVVSGVHTAATGIPHLLTGWMINEGGWLYSVADWLSASLALLSLIFLFSGPALFVVNIIVAVRSFKKVKATFENPC
jgi:hypothetical protein